MENEYQVLSHLQDNESTTQRGIAKRTAEGKHPRVVLYGPADEIEAILKNTLQKMEITPTIKRPAEDAFIPAADQHILTWRSEDEDNLPADSRVVNIMRLV